MSDRVGTKQQSVRELDKSARLARDLEAARAEVDRARKALHESDNRYRIVSELTSDYAYALRVDPDDQIEVEWVTGALRRLTGFTSEEIGERGGWKSLIHPDDMPIAMQQLGDLLRGQASVVEYRILHKDGQVRWMRDLARPEWNAEQKRTTCIHGAVQDVSARVQAERERRELERDILQAQNLESLGVMAGGIAHDINNLLVGILGYADLAISDLEPASIARPQIEQIKNSALQLAGLTSQLLAYAGKGPFHAEQIELEKLITEMVRLLEISIPKHVAVRYDFEPDLPAIEADPSQVRQVVMNLVTNAADSITGGPGTLAVRAGRVRLTPDLLGPFIAGGELDAGDGVMLTVQDSGEGMDAATQERIFEPFFTTKFAGRGLGLAAVLGIVRRHRGGIRVDSEPGLGTTVEVVFPLSQTLDSGSTDPAASTDAAGPRVEISRFAEGIAPGTTVLVVDDEDAVREVAGLILERAGCAVLPARDGPEALAIFEDRSEEIDVILLDLTMPKMDGIQTYRAIRKLSRQVPVILASGFSEQDVGERLGEDTPTALLHKPFDAETILCAVGSALQTDPARGPGRRVDQSSRRE